MAAVAAAGGSFSFCPPKKAVRMALCEHCEAELSGAAGLGARRWDPRIRKSMSQSQANPQSPNRYPRSSAARLPTVAPASRVPAASLPFLCCNSTIRSSTVSAGDQFIDKDGLCLADPVGSVGRLVLPGCLGPHSVMDRTSQSRRHAPGRTRRHRAVIDRVPFPWQAWLWCAAHSE